MRVDAYAADGRKVTLRVAHSDLEDCVGQATAAFGLECMQKAALSADGSADGDGCSSSIAPGVWFPAELGADARANILRVARERAIVWDM
jgi:hypothetical protein